MVFLVTKHFSAVVVLVVDGTKVIQITDRGQLMYPRKCSERLPYSYVNIYLSEVTLLQLKLKHVIQIDFRQVK